MILFVNGPFGVGKTTVANALVGEMPHAILYDPEVIGAALKRVLGLFRQVGDFQDYYLWRKLVVAGARVLRRTTRRTLVIPMTVYRRDVFDPVAAGLRGIDKDLACFRLAASREVLVYRITSDREDREAYAWRASHVEVCLEALDNPAFGTEIRTDSLTPAEVADRILQSPAMSTG